MESPARGSRNASAPVATPDPAEPGSCAGANLGTRASRPQAGRRPATWRSGEVPLGHAPKACPRPEVWRPRRLILDDHQVCLRGVVPSTHRLDRRHRRPSSRGWPRGLRLSAGLRTFDDDRAGCREPLAQLPVQDARPISQCRCSHAGRGRKARLSAAVSSFFKRQERNILMGRDATCSGAEMQWSVALWNIVESRTARSPAPGRTDG